jgi:hypothetical protein
MKEEDAAAAPTTAENTAAAPTNVAPTNVVTPPHDASTPR